MTTGPTSPPRAGSSEWHHDELAAGGLRFHVVRAGDGPAVLLLHGFPDFWYSWRYQIPALAAAGFRVIAPDLRGYNASDKPSGVKAYDIDLLAADVAALADATATGRVHLAGHDWGGIVAWYAAMQYPEKFQSLVVLNAPHPATFARDLFTTRQWLRSWYMFFFQLPGLPEAMVRLGNFRSLDETYSREVFGRDAFAHREIDDYKAALAMPGALTSAINYYRAAFRRFVRAPRGEHRPIEIPTLLLWGDRDRHLGSSLTVGLDPWVPDLKVRHFPDAGHWLQLDEPDIVNRMMIDFFSSASR
ncbi:MAG TPA: alpha/beta fold hydrolase [Candidatus Limnocylindrales bacterium]|nr:alpha/beta fold hydrolase [Candidatus Limnocylindrales bacterium]